MFAIGANTIYLHISRMRNHWRDHGHDGISRKEPPFLKQRTPLPSAGLPAVGAIDMVAALAAILLPTFDMALVGIVVATMVGHHLMSFCKIGFINSQVLMSSPMLCRC